MTKSIPKELPPKKRSSIPEKYQHGIAIFLIYLSLLVFFWGIIIDEKTFIASDTIAGKSFQTLMKDAEAQGIFPLWNPYIFCGMPGYASLSVFGSRTFDISDALFNNFRNFFSLTFLNNCEIGYIFVYYLLLGIGVYWLVYKKLKNIPAALIAGLAVMHTTSYIIFIMIGHMTKVPVISFLPYVLLILEELQKKFRWWLALLLAIVLHYMLKPTHLQVIFYCYFTLGIYYLYYIIRALIKKESIAGFIRSGLTLVVASILAAGMTADQYLQTYEYSHYSIRGTSPILERNSLNEASKNTELNGGLDYDYATSWSFAPSEIVTFFIPSAYGFGWHTYKGILTRNQPMRLNTYFGPQPFVDGPQYMGILVLLLGILGFWKYRKEPFVQFIGIVIILALLMSFGKEFPLLYNAMFYYFPFFNKFRVPLMILMLVQFFMPILAAYGVHWILTASNHLPAKQIKIWRHTGTIVGVLAILSFAAKDIFIAAYQIFIPKQSALEALSRSYGSNSMVLEELYKDITQMVVSDISIALLLITALCLLSLMAWKNKISSLNFGILLTALILIDLWRVNERPKEMFPKQKLEESFATPDYVRFLQQNDTSLFRVLEFENGHPPYNNALAYWRIQNAYGYHGAKMRQIQDIFDVVGIGNPLLWGLMDVKYIISDRPDSSQLFASVFNGQRYVLYNRAHMPRAFFVNRYEVAKDIDILTNIKDMNFDPMDVAFLMDDPKLTIDPPKDSASVKYSRYGIQDLELDVTATGNNLLFLSESWYPAGWKAYLDGQEAPIYRLNYMFRGIAVPPGTHKIAMTFKPQTFYVGKTISLIINLITVGGLLCIGTFYGITYLRLRKRQ
ncbi:MAG TPA: YfhO family protein [Bacteroidota bacterium]|nr:YfhO family protein [Bacteroidota bacterium]